MTHAAPRPAPVVDDTASTPEPVLIASAVQACLVAAAALGWTYLTDVRIAAVVTAVATIATVATAMIARGRVRAHRPTDPAAPDPTAAALRDVVRAELAAILRDGTTTVLPHAAGPASATSPWFTPPAPP